MHDLNHVMLALMVEHHARIPVLMKPIRGHTSDARDFGQVVTEHMRQLQTTDGTTYLVANCAHRSSPLCHVVLEHTLGGAVSRIDRDATASSHRDVQYTS